MKPIRVIDLNFNLLDEIDNYKSFIITRKWHTYGEFQLVINRHLTDITKLAKNNIVFLNSKKAGIIKHREIKLDENGKDTENLLVKGYTLEYIFSQRITIPPIGEAYDSISDNVEDVIHHYINNNVVNPIDVNRKIDLITLESSQNKGNIIDWQSRYKNLSEELKKISLKTDINVLLELDFDNSKLLTTVNEGTHRCINQEINPPIIFSPDFDNIKGQSYIDSDFNYKNFGYAGGQGEGASRTIAQYGNSTGIDRHETFIDARDLTTEDELKKRAAQKLLEMVNTKTFEGSILDYTTFKFQEDFDLGDIVTIQNKDWGVTMDARIIEAQEVYEESGFNLELTFGNNFPTLIDKIKQNLDQISGEITK